MNKEEAKKISQEEEEEEKKGDAEEEKIDDVDEIEKLKQEFLAIYAKLNEDPKKPIGSIEWIEKNLIKSEEFEKDNDANWHIDFMYSMGNCRAQCYKLDPANYLTSPGLALDAMFLETEIKLYLTTYVEMLKTIERQNKAIYVT